MAIDGNVKKEYYPYVYPHKSTETKLKIVEQDETVLDEAIRIGSQQLQKCDPTDSSALRQIESYPTLTALTAATQHHMRTKSRSRSNPDLTQDNAPDRDDGADNNNNSEYRIQDGDILQQTSYITDKDYEDDEEFRDIFRYVTTGGLTGNDKKDKVTLLIADQYFVENKGLYRLSAPRNKRVARMRPLTERLCIPRKFRFDLLTYYYNNLGHFGVQRLFLSLSQKVYWKQLFQDVTEFCKTCDTCLRAKRYFRLRPPPLHPLPVPISPFSHWALDHKTLSRKTKQGNVAILCCIDAFSGWPVLQAVEDLTAFTTAKVFFKHVVAQYGTPTLLISDKGPAFSGALFNHMAKLLNITHRTSSATTARSNGVVESCVKRVSELIKIYAKDDTEIEDILPVLEIALRSTASTRLGLLPYHLFFGREMPLAKPNSSVDTSTFTGDHKQYFDWLAQDKKILHEAVRKNKLEIKEGKKQYDKKNAVVTPTYAVGDQVLLYDNRIRPHSDQVLTHRNYTVSQKNRTPATFCNNSNSPGSIAIDFYKNSR